MLIFLIITILFWLGGNAALKILFEATKQEGFLDTLFGWQKMLDRFYGKGSTEKKSAKYYMWLHNALGGCERCTSFWFMPMWFYAYYIVSKFAFGHWVTDNLNGHWLLIITVNWIWYCLFHVIGAMSGFLVLIKLFKKKTNVV